MLVNYKLHIKKGAFYYCIVSQSSCIVQKDYWTTIKLPEGVGDYEIKYYGKPNLMKQIAKGDWKNIRMWKNIDLFNQDIEIFRP